MLTLTAIATSWCVWTVRLSCSTIFTSYLFQSWLSLLHLLKQYYLVSSLTTLCIVIFPSLWSKVSLILVHCSLYSHSRHTSCVFHLTSPRPFLPRERSAFTDFFTETVSLFFLVSLWLFSSSQHLCPLPSHSFSFNDEFPLYPWWMSLLLPSFSVS